MKLHYITYLLILGFTAYQIGMIRLFGIPKSISETWYKLNTRYENWSLLFTILLIFIGGYLWSISTLFSDIPYSILFAVSGSGAMFVGMAPAFAEKYTKTVHFLGAIILIFFGGLALGMCLGLWVVLIILMISSIIGLLFKIKNGVFWFELIAFYSIIIGILIRL